MTIEQSGSLYQLLKIHYFQLGLLVTNVQFSNTQNVRKPLCLQENSLSLINWYLLHCVQHIAMLQFIAIKKVPEGEKHSGKKLYSIVHLTS